MDTIIILITLLILWGVIHWPSLENFLTLTVVVTLSVFVTILIIYIATTIVTVNK
jgi:hypothetical protein